MNYVRALLVAAEACAPVRHEFPELRGQEEWHEDAHRHGRGVEGQPQHIHLLLQHLHAHASYDQPMRHVAVLCYSSHTACSAASASHQEPCGRCITGSPHGKLMNMLLLYV